MKAILVIDMPKKCGDCKLFMNNGNSYWCAKTGYDTTSSSMPSNCLKPIPQKLNDLNIEDTIIKVRGREMVSLEKAIKYAKQKGYNACIDEILGE